MTAAHPETAAWVTIAVLGKPRGNRGELTAISFSSHPERFTSLKSVHLFGDGSSFTVEEAWFHQGVLIFKFAGVDSISDAELLAGFEVRVPFSERAVLPSGEFYLSDLIGCQVFDAASRRPLGQVTGFEDGGSSGLLELGPGILIPFHRDLCVSIDPHAREILVNLPDGLLDLNR